MSAIAVRFSGVPLAEAVRMATLNPAKLLSFDDGLGASDAGEEASLVVFRWDEEEQALQVCQTLLNEEVAYSAP
jgi:N-acetylglucosamine-6-phosphate deacetylase